MSTTYNLGLTFIAPSEGDTNWAPVEDAKNIRISQHDHTGGGMGTQIGTTALAADSVNATKIRLGNNTSLRARNALDNADLNLFRLTTGNIFELMQPTIIGGASSLETLTSNGAISVALACTALNGSSLVMTLADGAVGQLKQIVNVAATTATVTPATTTVANTISLLPGAAVLLWFRNGNWLVIGSTPGTVVTDDIQATTATSGTYTITGRVFTFNNAGATTATFNVGAAGQRCTVHNIGAGTVTLTLTGRPAATDVATILQGGSLELVMINSLWQPFVGVGTTLA